MGTETLSNVPRLRAVELVAVGLVSMAVVALHGYGAALSRDAGVFVYGGTQVVDGVPPYVGIFNSVGPLADLLPALGIGIGRLVGVDDPVLAARLLFTVLTAVSCVLVAVLARDVFGSRAAAYVAPAVLLAFRTYVALGAGGPREKTAMVVFLLAGLILLLRRRWLAAGACTALATLTWQPALLVACAAALVGVAALRESRLRAAGAFVLGGMIPTAVAVAYFAGQGALRVAVDGFLLINLEDTRQPSLIGSPNLILPRLTRDYGWSLSLVVGLVALTALAVLALRHRPVDVGVLVVGAGGLTAAAWTCAVINGAPDLFVVLPFAALGVAGLVAAVVARLAPRPGWALTGVVAAAATVAATAGALTGGAGLDHGDLDQQRANVAAVLAAAPPDSTISSINAPQVLVLAGRTNTGSHQIFDPGKTRYLEQHYPGGIEGYMRWVDEQHPDLIASRRRFLPSWAQSELGADYRYAGTGPGWSWFVARSAGLDVAARVRDANRSA